MKKGQFEREEKVQRERLEIGKDKLRKENIR